MAENARPSLSALTEDAASSHVGSAILASASAAMLREQIAADGEDSPPRKPTNPRGLRQRKPGWWATIALCVISTVVGTPLWDAFTGEAQRARELGQLTGRIDALEGRANSLAATEIRAAAERAVEWRELDAKIVALGANVEALLVRLEVPPSERRTIPPTSAETARRHEEAERLYQSARAAADRRAVEQALASHDTVSPP